MAFPKCIDPDIRGAGWQANATLSLPRHAAFQAMKNGPQLGHFPFRFSARRRVRASLPTGAQAAMTRAISSTLFE
jgi:hypothetical protein